MNETLVYNKSTKKYEPIDHPDWLYKLNFKCLKRPEMDVSVGRARIIGKCHQRGKVFLSRKV